jgi:fatty-acyl-CoA synthase
VWSPNCVEWVVAEFALARAGLICATLNPTYRLNELEFALNKTACRALITPRAFRSSQFIDMLTALMPELSASRPGELRAARVPSLRWVIQIGGEAAPGCVGFDEIGARAQEADREQLAAVEANVQFDAPVCIQFTSGTTGTPKGATLSHHNVINNAAQLVEAMGMRSADRLCVPVPMFHCFGYVGSALVCALSGAAMVFPGPAFDPLAVLETVQDERCTALHGVPTMFIAELAHADFARFDLSSLRTGGMAGAPCPEAIMRQVIDRMHMRDVLILFGMTETSPIATGTAPDDTIDRRVGTVGRVVPHVEIKIIDAKGRTVPRGTAGEFCTRGYSVMLGYWDDPKGTDEAIDAAGWMHTGDLVSMDADGYCQVVGRLKDMIKRGGEAIFPREIEEFLLTHPDVRDVHVFGVPHDRWGEEVCAWISCRDNARLTERDIREFCRDKISRQKIPRHVRFVTTFPMTGSGKVQKYVMREQMAQELRSLEPRESRSQETWPQR